MIHILNFSPFFYCSIYLAVKVTVTLFEVDHNMKY